MPHRHQTIHRLAAGALFAALAALPAPARAQDPVPRDTAAADTIDLDALEARLLGELGAEDSTRPAVPQPAAGGAASLNPDISLIADFVADLSPDAATLEGGDRFQLREVELGIQGSVDPYFRYDAFLAVHDGAIEVEEGYATTLGLPAGLQVKLGKFLVPFGKVNLTHRPELNTVDYPLLHQLYFGAEGLSSTGVWLSALGAPLGFFQEVSLLATNGAGEHAHEEEEHADAGKSLFDDLADRLWVAHLKNFWTPSEATSLELGGSWASSATDEPQRLRTSFYGVDAIWRWKPPARATYRSAILQAEAAWRNASGPAESRFAAFLFGQWQLTRRTYVGARYDHAEPPDAAEGALRAGQVLLRYFPTEFSQLRLVYERQAPEDGDALDRLLFQTTFALGPHRPHAY